jgi:hypothetical protein
MAAELGAHVLHMCPIQWQDQYNMNEKGMMPMDMHLLLTLLEEIERVCTYEKGKLDSHKKSEKSSRCGACLGGSKSNAVNLILRLFLYHFLHMMSL